MKLSAPATRVLLVAFGGLLAAYDLPHLFRLLAARDWPPGDFFALWSFGRFAARFPLPLLYDDAALAAFQSWLGAVALDAPYPYPPHFALLLVPFTRPGPIVAYWLWMLPGLAAFLWAAGAGTGWRCRTALVLLPATIVGLAAGQNGFLSAALMLGGLRMSGSRPLRAGVLLGLLSYKPQLGLLVPVALAAAGRWRALAAAAGTATTIVAAVGLCCGWDGWTDWLEALRRHSHLHGAIRRTTAMMPTPTALFLLLGLSPAAARIGQAMVGLAAAVAVWTAWRRVPRAAPEGIPGGAPDGGPGRDADLAVAASCAAAFLATPYAFHYDLPMLGAGTAIVLRDRLGTGSGLNAVEALALMVVALMPIALNAPDPNLPLGAPACAMLLALALRRPA